VNPAPPTRRLDATESRGRRALAKAGALLAVLVLALTAYLVSARPAQLRWGATDLEVERAMPGDSLNPHPAFLATRAITIRGTPAEIWPWLIQMGYGRAGFYGYDILENLGSKRGLRSADRILPELQHFKVGDVVPISPAAVMAFYAIEPNRYLVWTGQAGGTYGVFTWALYPVEPNHTRLVSRIRWSHHWVQPRLLALDLFSEFTDHLAVRKILEGVRDRVEDRSAPMRGEVLEFGVYLAVALTFVASLVLLLIRPLEWRGWLVSVGAGAAWLITWYAPLPASIGFLFAIAVVCALVRSRRDSPSTYGIT